MSPARAPSGRRVGAPAPARAARLVAGAAATRARAARLVAGALLAIVAPCPLATSAAASSLGEVRAPTARRSWTARVVVATAVRARPELNAPRTGRVGTIAAWNGGSVRLLVLAARTDVRGRRWIKVRLPERPNARSGWMRADFARLSAVRWRFVIDLRARRGRAYYDGQLKRSWPVVIGKRATPTPRGRFAVYERVRQPAGSELGPYALHLTAHSRALFSTAAARAGSPCMGAAARCSAIHSGPPRRMGACGWTTASCAGWPRGPRRERRSRSADATRWADPRPRARRGCCRPGRGTRRSAGRSSLRETPRSSWPKPS